MKRLRQTTFVAALLLLEACASAPAQQSEPAPARPRPSAEAMIIDGLIYRPLSLAGTVVGTGVFLLTLPFSLPGGNAGDAGQALVVDPAREAFGRCLGCIDHVLDPGY